MHAVLERVEDIAVSLEEHAAESDSGGRLADVTVKELRGTGVVRMFQPREFGGYEAHPVEFSEAIMAIASRSGSAGWVSGVVGVHPWELAQVDHKLQVEIWGEDPETWVASPYAPMGRARVTDGGYLLTGRWPFSSGTDMCDWIILGGMVTDADGAMTSPPQMRHFVLPRADYEIVGDSWDVMGLKGSGSKDVIVRDAFVPDYRVVNPAGLEDGSAARAAGRDNPTYSMPFGVVFPGAIAVSTIGIAEGALGAFAAYTRQRVNAWGGAKATNNPFQMAAFGSASADVDASRLQVLTDMSRMYDSVAAGRPVTLEQRIVSRRNQVRSARRAVDAVDTLFALAGGNSIRSDLPLQRFWRDMHASMNHICNVAEPTYQAFALHSMGEPIPPTIKI